MRIVLTGGGTAGHLSPGIAVAESLREACPAVELSWICGRRELDDRLLSRAGLAHYALPVSPFPYGFSLRGVVSGAHLITATVSARQLLRRLRPAAVLGVGGYTSVPVAMAARTLRIPVLLHVLDAQPDRANRLLCRWATSITLAFAEAAAAFSGYPVQVTGCPVRRAVREAWREQGQQALRLDPALSTVVVMGGSQGARRINQALLGALPELLASLPLQVVHLTGQRDWEEVQTQTAALGALRGRYFPLAFTDEIGPLLAAADLVVGRAGASSVAEASVLGRPQLLIPYPHAGGHQRANAEALVSAGASLALPDAECDPARLGALISDLVGEPDRLQVMGEAARRWSSPDAADHLAAELLSLAQTGA